MSQADLLLGGVAGIATKLLYTPVHEASSTTFLKLYTSSNLLLAPLYLLRLPSTSLLSPFLRLLLINLVFLSSLLLTTAVFRLFLHPLRRFPGNRLAALSKFYESYVNLQGRNALVVQELHRAHGDFVRTGPNELSINNVNALPALYGRDSLRGPFYEAGLINAGGHSMSSTRDPKQHTMWRRIWENGFTSKAVASYSPRVEYHVNKLIGVLTRLGGRETNCVDLMDNMAFDIMADLGFGRDMHMQEGTGDSTYMGFMHQYMATYFALGSVRNLVTMVPYFPQGAGTKNFIAKGYDWCETRRAQGKSRADVFTHLLGEDSETGTVFNNHELMANVLLMIVAGTDTTSVVLSSAFRQLAMHPGIQQKLHAELDEAFPSVDSEIMITHTQGLKYVQGVINETLRMFPPLPSGVQTMAPASGVTIDGVFVPGGVAVRVHHLTLQRDERYFPRGDEFIPERWEEGSPLIRDKRAFIPFAIGPNSCLGKQLALNEMRLVMSRVMRQFTVSFGESHDDEKYIDGWRDWYTVKLGDMYIKFTPRNSKEEM